MDRSDDATKRLEALHQPIPRPTKGDVARNKAEIDSRVEATTVQRALNLIKKGPDVANAARVGDPPLVDPEPVAATSIVSGEARAAMGVPEKGAASLQIVNPDLPAASTPSADATSPGGSPFGHLPTSTASAVDPNELKPNAPADPNELKPTDSGADQALPPPTQVNEIQQGSSSSATASADSSAPASDQEISSSKKKKKKGLRKLIPF